MKAVLSTMPFSRNQKGVLWVGGVFLLAGFWMGCSTGSNRVGREVASIPKEDGDSTGVDLRALRSIASQASVGGPDQKPGFEAITASEVAKLLEANRGQFKPEVDFSKIEAKGETLVLELRNASLTPGSLEKLQTPRCHMNENEKTPETLALTFSGTFERQIDGDVTVVRFSELGFLEKKDRVVKNMTLKFSSSKEQNRLVGFDFYDIASGFTAPFNAFWSGKSVLCSAEEGLGQSREPASITQKTGSSNSF